MRTLSAVGQPQAQANVCSVNRLVGVCLGNPRYRYMLRLVSICGFVTTVSGGWCGSGSWVGCPICVRWVTVGGRAAPPWEVGLPFGVVELIFTYVCVSLYQ